MTDTAKLTLEEIERLEKLLARDKMYHLPGTREDLASEMYDHAPALIEAAKAALADNCSHHKTPSPVRSNRAGEPTRTGLGCAGQQDLSS